MCYVYFSLLFYFLLVLLSITSFSHAFHFDLSFFLSLFACVQSILHGVAINPFKVNVKCKCPLAVVAAFAIVYERAYMWQTNNYKK